MPFTSKKQKKTIDAAAHNPDFAKKVGIKTSVAKKMSAHGKGQTKFEEATDTVEKDEKGNVKSWKHEGDWEKAKPTQGRGKVTNLSDKARRKTEKMSKPEKEMAEAFETALEGSIRGGVWTSQPPDKGQKDVPPPQEVDGGILNKKQPKPVNAPRGTKKAEIDQPTQVAATGDDETVAETKKKPSKIKTAMKNNKIKALKENIKLVSQLLAEAKGASKCSCAKNEDTCKVHSKMKEGKKAKPDFLDMDKDGDKKEPMKKAIKDKKVKEGAMSDLDADKKEKQYKGTQAYHAKKKAEKEPEGTYSKKRFETDGQRVARLAKEKRQAEKKKVDESKDLYMESLYQKLQNQLNG